MMKVLLMAGLRLALLTKGIIVYCPLACPAQWGHFVKIVEHWLTANAVPNDPPRSRVVHVVPQGYPARFT